MQLDTPTVRAVTHEVCSTTLSMPIFDRELPSEIGRADEVAAEVEVAGGWNARISVVASKNLARKLAGRMFQQDAASIEDSDMEDSLCELANIIGGNLKGIVGAEADLSIPAFREVAPAELIAANLAAAFEHETDSFCVFVQNA